MHWKTKLLQKVLHCTFLEISNCSTLRFVELILEEVAQSQHRNTCSRSAMNNASLNRQIVTQSYRQSLAFACSKSTMKTPEQCVKFVQSWQKNARTVLLTFWWLFCWLRTDFAHCSGISVFDFEQVYASWVNGLNVALNVFKVNSEDTRMT